MVYTTVQRMRPVTIAALLSDLPQLTDILKHHVVGDSVMSTMLTNNQIVTTLEGTDVIITINSMGVYINNARVTIADLIADNGVVHVIDAVLLPNVTGINEQITDKKSSILYSVNILGKKVKTNTKNTIIFDVYNDGTIIKKYNP